MSINAAAPSGVDGLDPSSPDGDVHGTPQLEHGFVQITYDLLFALMSDLGGARGACLAAVIRDQYGAMKLESSSIPRAEIADSERVSPGAVRESIRRLANDGLIRRDDSGRIQLAKDFRSWKSLTPDQVAFALAQRGRHTGVTSHGCDAITPKRHTGVTQASHGRDAASHGRDALLSRDFNNYNTPRDAPAHTHVHAREDGPETVPQIPATVAFPAPPDIEDLRKLIDYADRVSAGAWVRLAPDAARAGFPIPILMAAMEEAVTLGKSDWRYVIGIAKRLRAQGGPDKPKPFEGGSGRRWKTLEEEQAESDRELRVALAKAMNKTGVPA